MTKYYDRNGDYKAYTKNDKHIFSDTDEYIGYLLNGVLYNEKDAAIGRVMGKWIIARNGQPLFGTK